MNEEKNINQLPKDWKWIRLGDLVDNPKQDLVDGPFGSNLKSDEYIDSGIPVFKIQNIKVNRFVEKHMSFISEAKAKTLIRHSFQTGDLIITKLGEPLGLCCKVPKKYPFGIIVADLMRLRPSKTKIYDKYLINVINSDVVKKQFKTITKGTTRARVNLTIVRDIEIPVPPKPTQQAIVSKIEELFSELDKGIENLRTAQQQLKTYRQSVLKWAFDGKLTNENVKDGELSKVWKWKRLGDMFDFIGGGTPSKSEKDYWNGTIFWASVKDVKGDYLNKTQNTITEQGLKNSASNLADPGDVILITRISPGKSIISNVKSAINQDLKIAKPKFKTTSKFINYFFNAIERDCIKIASGTTVLGITLNNLNELEIPELNIEEQNNVVQEIESRLSVADKMEESIIQSLQQAEALRQSILKKAFEGKLVATDTIETIKQTSKVIPLERKVLAGKIIHLLHEDRYFGLTKFQKIFYLVENFSEVKYETNFIQERAGPYDKEFTTSFRKEMQEKDWVQEEQKGSITKFIPGENIGSLIANYGTQFREKGKQIVFVIQQLKDKSTHDAELIATLYAVWNNRLIKKKPVKVELLVEDFFKWSPKKKEEFQEGEIINTYNWMKAIKFSPKGFGISIESNNKVRL